MHAISLTTLYGPDNKTCWFATEESNLCHSDNKWNNLLFPITSDEQFQINQSYSHGTGRFRYYRDWQFEYNQSTHCCQINHSVIDSHFGVITDETMVELVKGIPPDIIPHEGATIDYELQEIVNWLGENATDVWSINLGTYGAGRSFFLKNTSDYKHFMKRFSATDEEQSVNAVEITDIIEKLLQERRDRLKSERQIWETINWLESKIKS